MTGLGVTTVSRALKDAPEIGEETRRRVQLVARQVGYRPNRAGVRLRTGKTNVISLVLNTEEQIGGFVSDIDLRHFRASGADALSPDRHALFAQQRSDGACALRRGDRLGRRHHHFAHRARTISACATCWSAASPSPRTAAPNGSTGIPSTISTTTPSRGDAVRKLAALGRKRLALLAPPSALSYHHHTRDGFADAMAEIGLSPRCRSTRVTVDHSIEQIRAATLQLMQRENRPDGIVSGAGGATFALVAGIEDAGLRSASDIDIVSKQSSRAAAPVPAGTSTSSTRMFAWPAANWPARWSALIDGAPLESLQSLVVPSDVVSPQR